MSPQEFATDIVVRLQNAGFQALWAGGCVRDHLLGQIPKDFDVATDAQPSQVRELFGLRRTIAIGESFGVITVLGTENSGNIEVATFRRDGGYTDGRRPDSVEFTDAREDALRRDFTINGMFFDPVKNQLIDHVDGRADLECRIVRAIGDPSHRINEDKLRMLRAVRFASTFDFVLDEATANAVQQHAPQIKVVSAERIGAEMRRMLAHENRALAAELLRKFGLLREILLDGERLYENRSNWRTRLRWMKDLGGQGTFEQAAAILLSRLIGYQGLQPTIDRWKLSNAESDRISWIEGSLLKLSRAHQLPWSTVQPLLISKHAEAAMEIVEIEFGSGHQGVRFCRERLHWPTEKLNPAPLICGADLIDSGIGPGPIFAKILAAVREAQLNREIESPEQAMKLAKQILNADRHPADQ